MFFLNYLKIKCCFSVDAFKVGLDISVEMEVRPRSLNGVVFSIHGDRDFVLLQFVSGEVRTNKASALKTI